jgi:hypothetical protein
LFVSLDDLRALENLVDDWASERLSRDDVAAADLVAKFFMLRPQLLMAYRGFDEYVALCKKTEASFTRSFALTTGPAPLFRKPSGRWLRLSAGELDRYGVGQPHRLGIACLPRDWVGDPEDSDDAELANQWFAAATPVENILRDLRSRPVQPVEPECRLWMPDLWTPQAQEQQRISLSNSVTAILRALRTQAINMEQLTWSQLEDVVAEVLRAQGLEIHVVRERPQGGRDLIARGELIPGEEPSYLAVEVKHKSVVQRPEVQAALWQNRAYPALLVVTSGVFSAGVLREKALAENRFRLVLKDGDALNDMIRRYLDHEFAPLRATRLSG